MTDPEGMLATVEASPDQWAEALALVRDVPEFAPPGSPGAVLVAGMGGSGIAADVARVLAEAGGTAPIVPVKGYDLPAWAGPDTPLIAVSHSGGTEETLAAVAEGIDRGCPLLAVTSGGNLADLAADRGAPVVIVPGGRQPRASVAYLAVPVLVGLDRAGVLPGAEKDLETVPDHLRTVRAAWGDEPASAADSLVGRVPVLVGGRGVGALVALRGKCQINENAEAPAFAAELPELDHNEVVGWGGGPDVPWSLIEIRDPHDHSQVVRRFDVTGRVTADDLPVAATHRLSGSSRVAALAGGILWVDLVSVHLALATGVDPTPVQRITRLKQLLSEAG